MINVNKKFFLLILTLFGSVHIDIKAAEDDNKSQLLSEIINRLDKQPQNTGIAILAALSFVEGSKFLAYKLLNHFAGSATQGNTPPAPVILQLKEGDSKNIEHLMNAIIGSLSHIYENKDNKPEDFEALEDLKKSLPFYDESSLKILLTQIRADAKLSSLRHTMEHLNPLNKSKTGKRPETFTTKNVIEKLPKTASPKEKINAVTNDMYAFSNIKSEDYSRLLRSLEDSDKKGLPLTTNELPEAIAETLWNCMFPDAGKATSSLSMQGYLTCKEAAAVMALATKQNTTPTPPPATKNNNPQPQGGNPKPTPPPATKNNNPQPQSGNPKSVTPPQQPGTGK